MKGDTMFVQNYRDNAKWIEGTICNDLNLELVSYLFKATNQFNL